MNPPVWLLAWRPAWLRRFARPQVDKSKASDVSDVPLRRIWVDLSLIAQHDRRTGIQRVVRNVFAQLQAAPPPGFEVAPVVSFGGHPYRVCPLSLMDSPLNSFDFYTLARPCRGDVFLGLDLAPRLISLRVWQLVQWRRSGVKLYFLVYDLLPASHPEWFNALSVRWYRRWLRAIAALADGLICISATASRELDAYMSALICTDDRPRSMVINLGVETAMIRDRAQSGTVAAVTDKRDYVLMVGTLEPRKAYGDVIDAFERLWAMGETCALVVAGRQGWKIDHLTQRFHSHPEAGKRLIWVNGPSDPELDLLYEGCLGLLMASYGEGFGLPVVEALQHGKPVLVRDIPVLREVAIGTGVSYFTDGTPQGLVTSLTLWLQKLRGPDPEAGSLHIHVAWSDCRSQLLRHLGLQESS